MIWLFILATAATYFGIMKHVLNHTVTKSQPVTSIIIKDEIITDNNGRLVASHPAR
ncbi:hypothetical protein [Peribacillus kribbensis]|uniref:hypothetical protein n=1 Tax=Peribacillus kribbensis TaxID=356658 RepID=UPI00041A91F0|nr:hypothetical protein [Peribacillus kribbensis]